MTEITLDTFWNLENRKITSKWVGIILFLLIEADLKSYSPPTVTDIMVSLKISDKNLASYTLSWTQNFFDKLVELNGSSEAVLKELAKPPRLN